MTSTTMSDAAVSAVRNTVPEVFNRTADRYAEEVAYREKALGLWHDTSWSRYHRLVSQVGAALSALGLEPRGKAAIIGDNCPEWVVADLGIQSAGGVSVGIYATNAWSQVEYITVHSDASFLFVENEEQLDKWLRFKERTTALKRVIVWDTEGLRDFADPMLMTWDQLLEKGADVLDAQPDILSRRQAAVTEDDLSALIYTSGTTGPPKAAMLSHGNVTWMAQAVVLDNPIESADEVLSYLPLCHIFERLFSVYAHITHAYTVNFVEQLSTITENMMEVSPTVGYAVPRIWEKYFSTIRIRMSEATWFKRAVFGAALGIGRRRAELLMASKPVPRGVAFLYAMAYGAVFRKLKERLGFERLRVAYSGAAPISPDVLLFFQSIGVNLIEGYGQTEGTGVTTLSKIGRVRFGTVGPALQGVSLRIAEDGEILVKSPGVFKGYYKDPETTQEALTDGWLHSGDVGELDEAGYLRITDRKKDIIVTAGGKNITPQYIENKLKASVYINDAVIIGDRRKFLSALIMIDEDNVVKFAQDQKIQFSTYRDLTRDDAINQLIQDEVTAVNTGLARVENVRKFVILPKKLYVEDGEVTPTMKVKRAFVNKAFKELIDGMYA